MCRDKRVADKEGCISGSNEFLSRWNEVKLNAERDWQELLVNENRRLMWYSQVSFWEEIQHAICRTDLNTFRPWFENLDRYLHQLSIDLSVRRKRKAKSLCQNANLVELERNGFEFFEDLRNFQYSFPIIINDIHVTDNRRRRARNARKMDSCDSNMVRNDYNVNCIIFSSKDINFVDVNSATCHNNLCCDTSLCEECVLRRSMEWANEVTDEWLEVFYESYVNGMVESEVKRMECSADCGIDIVSECEVVAQTVEVECNADCAIESECDVVDQTVDDLEGGREKIISNVRIPDNIISVEGSDRITGKFVSQNVFNLSKRTLTEAEISLLSKGLKFCETPKELNRAQLKKDLESFGRKLRLRWHFKDEEGDFSEVPLFKRKSTFNPKNEDVQIEFYLSRLEEEIMSIKAEGSNYSNLSQVEQQALRDLRNDESIVIKGADKGSGVVVWDKGDYLKEASRQLADGEVYEECESDPLPELQALISETLAKICLREDLPEQTIDYFRDTEKRLGRFYLLPKIHKRTFNVPGRPVISNCGYHTENISSFLDHVLQPLSKMVKSYIKDTNDFLRKVRDLPDLPEDAIFCTIDVVGLYPNIPHEDGLKAMKEALDKREDQSVSTETIMELGELVLKNNYFEHNSKIYKQKRGTAIGTKFAPPYAILFMGDFEVKALEGATLKPWVWWRYIDDVFLIWEHGEDSLDKFIDYLNSIHPTIKFTKKSSRTEIDFLDVLVSREGNRIKTSLFVKPTDTHQFLHFTSCHPYHTKSGIPYGQALRLRRICSDNDDFKSKVNDLKNWLTDRGFDRRMVTDQIDRAALEDRNSLLDKVKSEQEDYRINFVVTYHPALNRKLIQILNNNQYLLQRNEEHRKVFAEVPRVSFRKPKCLQDILVRAKLKAVVELNNGCESCVRCRSDCAVGDLLDPSTTFSAKGENRIYDIRVGPLHCKSDKVIYLLECKTCFVQYVGKSWPEFRARANNYKTKYRKYIERRDAGTLNVGKPIPQASLFEHFAQDDHHGISDWSFKLIDQATNRGQLLDKELFWQYQLNVFTPDGLNVRDAPAYG